tara:strand:- start:1672 stop:1875 length:204 start_codon:yes stop_codon:yes gene_type:complete
MKSIVVNKLKAEFHKRGIQITTGAVNILDDHIHRQIVNMAGRCKDGNVKRLTEDLIWVAIGNHNVQS